MLKRVQHGAAISRPTQLVSNSEFMSCVFMMCMNNWVRCTDMSYIELPDPLLWPKEIKNFVLVLLSWPLSMPAYHFKRARKLRLCCPLLVTCITTSELLPEPKTILVILKLSKSYYSPYARSSTADFHNFLYTKCALGRQEQFSVQMSLKVVKGRYDNIQATENQQKCQLK